LREGKYGKWVLSSSWLTGSTVGWGTGEGGDGKGGMGGLRGSSEIIFLGFTHAIHSFVRLRKKSKKKGNERLVKKYGGLATRHTPKGIFRRSSKGKEPPGNTTRVISNGRGTRIV